ncbi:ABC transporter permease [Geomonas subterranea]|uniref:ABC transporter permease n=1 Tax=Geomonas subterranea TaxID=2847989 RepID=A0ABX8LH61_9BACT|nr:ABC transporter permease [Geomonas subterranea]QXE91371.1 ABC transporter permease [Geomonas subterranea]QXM10542.1 ABC transporter permease [Geomonas subterranea]
MNDRTTLMHQALAVILFLSLWEVLPRTGLVNPLFIPPLSGVLQAICDLYASGELLLHARLSLGRALIGFGAAVAIGLPLGLVLGGWFPRIQTATEPLLELFAQANPVILAHIIIFFLGIGEVAKTFIIGWLCLWPIVFSSISGIRSVDVPVLKAARSLGLGRRQLFLKVVLPSAAPAICTGLRLASGYAFIMLVASEMMGGSNGIGWLIVQSQENYHVTRIFAGATVLTALAVAADLSLKLAEKRFVVWDVALSEDYLKLAPVRGEEP